MMRERAGSPLNVLTLVSYLAAVILPSLGTILLIVQTLADEDASTTWTGAVPILEAALLAISGALAAAAGFGSDAAPGRRIAAGVLGILVILLAAFALVAYDVFATLNLTLNLGGPLLFFSWAIARPFRGKGYFAILLWVALLVVSFGARFLAFPFALLGWPLAGHIVNLVVLVAVVLVPVLAALVWERRTPHPSARSAHRTATGTPDDSPRAR